MVCSKLNISGGEYRPMMTCACWCVCMKMLAWSLDALWHGEHGGESFQGINQTLIDPSSLTMGQKLSLLRGRCCGGRGGGILGGGEGRKRGEGPRRGGYLEEKRARLHCRAIVPLVGCQRERERERERDVGLVGLFRGIQRTIGRNGSKQLYRDTNFDLIKIL